VEAKGEVEKAVYENKERNDGRSRDFSKMLTMAILLPVLNCEMSQLKRTVVMNVNGYFTGQEDEVEPELSASAQTPGTDTKKRRRLTETTSMAAQALFPSRYHPSFPPFAENLPQAPLTSQSVTGEWSGK
jgi:hypothetical protein